MESRGWWWCCAMLWTSQETFCCIERRTISYPLFPSPLHSVLLFCFHPLTIERLKRWKRRSFFRTISNEWLVIPWLPFNLSLQWDPIQGTTKKRHHKSVSQTFPPFSFFVFSLSFLFFSSSFSPSFLPLSPGNLLAVLSSSFRLKLGGKQNEWNEGKEGK